MLDIRQIRFLDELNLTGNESRKMRFDCSAFAYVRAGTVKISDDNSTASYEQTAFLLLYPKQDWHFSADGEADMIILGIDNDFLQEHLNLLILSSCNSSLDVTHDYTCVKRRFLHLAADIGQASDCDSCLILGDLYLFLDSLQKIETDSFENAGGSDSRGRNPDARALAIARYIDTHCSEPLSLQNVAEAFYLAPQYLSALFKENFNVGFKEYLTRRRLFHAVRILRRTQDPISDVAAQSGFSSVSAFRRNFTEEYGESPLAYRKRYQSEKILPSSQMPTQGMASSGTGFENHSSARALSSFGSASAETPIHMAGTLNAAAPIGRIRRTEQILNIGNADHLLNDEFRQRLLAYLRVFPVPYIRLMNVVSSSFIPEILPDYTLLFQYADTALGFLYTQHLTPIIELSRQQFYFDFTGKSAQQYLYVTRSERYYRRLRIFLQHAAASWPANWLAEWKFELWMQPRETAASYVRDFAKIRKIIREVIPDAQLGGPGYHACVTPSSADAILDAFREQKVRPDFFSVYLNYHILNKQQGSAAISMDPDCLGNVSRDLRHLLDAYDRTIPLYATEWTSVCSSHIPTAYSLYQSAFVAHTLLSIWRFCDKTGYWIFADAAWNPADRLLNPALNVFGQGLFTRQYHRTPAAWTFAMLSRLGSNLISQNPGCLLVQSDTDHYQILFYIYSHPLAQEDPSLLTPKDYSNFDSLFGTHTPAEIDYELHGLKPGIWQLRRTILDSYHGSFLDVMMAGNRHSSIDPLAYSQYFMSYRNVWQEESGLFSSPEERIIYLRSDGTLRIRSMITRHSVALWDIRRLL